MLLSRYKKLVQKKTITPCTRKPQTTKKPSGTITSCPINNHPRAKYPNNNNNYNYNKKEV